MYFRTCCCWSVHNSRVVRQMYPGSVSEYRQCYDRGAFKIKIQRNFGKIQPEINPQNNITT